MRPVRLPCVSAHRSRPWLSSSRASTFRSSWARRLRSASRCDWSWAKAAVRLGACPWLEAPSAAWPEPRSNERSPPEWAVWLRGGSELALRLPRILGRSNPTVPLPSMLVLGDSSARLLARPPASRRSPAASARREGGLLAGRSVASTGSVGRVPLPPLPPRQGNWPPSWQDQLARACGCDGPESQHGRRPTVRQPSGAKRHQAP
mmetsp:Transcript_53415/g.173747  ORF Transcript_53415/g.173747 Transcript_53415/m.173747 type:complete len:205 (-) Transcript_53415:66-680(-)